MNKIEQWKPIQGYENYLISSHGRIKKKDKILSPSLCHGYCRITLYKDGKRKSFLIHRLVALAFIPNPYDLPLINHKDENKENNQVDNLEWCTATYNNSYGTAKERIKSQSTKIKCLDLKTNEITYYPSIKDAARQLEFRDNGSAIYYNIYNSKSPYKKRYIFSEIKEQEN